MGKLPVVFIIRLMINITNFNTKKLTSVLIYAIVILELGGMNDTR